MRFLVWFCVVFYFGGFIFGSILFYFGFDVWLYLVSSVFIYLAPLWALFCLLYGFDLGFICVLFAFYLGFIWFRVCFSFGF